MISDKKSEGVEGLGEFFICVKGDCLWVFGVEEFV